MRLRIEEMTTHDLEKESKMNEKKSSIITVYFYKLFMKLKNVKNKP